MILLDLRELSVTNVPFDVVLNISCFTDRRRLEHPILPEFFAQEHLTQTPHKIIIFSMWKGREIVGSWGLYQNTCLLVYQGVLVRIWIQAPSYSSSFVLFFLLLSAG